MKSTKDQVAAMVLAVGCGFAALAAGSATHVAAIVSGLFMLGATVPLLNSSRRFSRIPITTWFLLACAGFTALQLIPLPMSFLQRISPHAADILTGQAQALGTSVPSYAPITLDESATLRELGKFIMYLAAAFVGLRLAVHSAGRKILAMIIAGTGLAVALVGLGHYVLRAHKLYFFFEPTMLRKYRFLAPLLNPNHLAGLMTLSSIVSLGLMLVSEGRWRLFWIASAMICAGTSFFGGSRAGVISLSFGLFVLGGFWLYRRSRRKSRRYRRAKQRARTIAFAMVAVCAVTMLFAFTGEDVLRELVHTDGEELAGDAGKVAAWKSSKDVFLASPWVGVGRGGFEPAFTRFHGNGALVYSHIENEVLQTILDWGAPIAIFLFVLLGFALARAGRAAARGILESSMFAGLVALGLHNMADFGLQLPGVALPAVLALAALTYVELKVNPAVSSNGPGEDTLVESSKASARVKHSRLALLLSKTATRVTFITVCLAITLAAAGPWARTAREDNERLADSLASDDAAVDTMEVMKLWQKHPADYYWAGLSAQNLAQDGDNRAVPAINRALYLYPNHSGLHLIAADILEKSQKPEQALVEYSLALDYARGPRGIVLHILNRFAEPKLAARGLSIRPESLNRIIPGLRESARFDVMLAWGERILSERPDDATGLRLVSTAASELGDHKRSEETAALGLKLAPSGAFAILLASAYRAREANQEAVTTAQEAFYGRSVLATTLEKVRLAVILTDALIDLNRAEEARTTLHEALDLAGDKRSVSELHRAMARLEDAVGNHFQAQRDREIAEDTLKQ